jgi:hypothetical protein
LKGHCEEFENWSEGGISTGTFNVSSLFLYFALVLRSQHTLLQIHWWQTMSQCLHLLITCFDEFLPERNN